MKLSRNHITERGLDALYQLNYNTQKSNSQVNFNGKWKEVYNSAEHKTAKRITIHKYQNKRITSALNQIGENKRAQAIDECGTFFKLGMKNGHEIITAANFCRQRLCFNCQWRRAAKFTAQMFPVLERLSAEGFRFVFLTLTVRNCEQEEVPNTLNLLQKSWEKLRKRTKIMQINQGCVRSIEITYNEKDNTYHPHIHVLMAVKSNYAVEKYISQKELSKLWQECLTVDYIPIVYMQMVKRKNNNSNITKSAAIETLKYTFKYDYKTLNTEVVSTLLYSLKGKRLISFTGVIEDMRKKIFDIEYDEILTDNYNTIEGAEYEVLYLFNPSGWQILQKGE